MAKPIATKSARPMPVKKVTSIGGRAKPTNKHKRRSFKPYRGQGRV